MREIDPQSEAPREGDRLTGALRHLAASSRQGAPAELGSGLATAFRRHHRRRKLIRGMSVAALAACAALAAGLISLRSPQQIQSNTQTHETVTKAPDRLSTLVVPANLTATTARPATSHVKPGAANKRVASRGQFLALPGYDPGVPAEELSVVRVQLPASALWQMGAPVSPDSGARKFMADFVVAQDGTPYAVRLVQ